MENSVTIADLVLVQFEAPSEVSFSENNIVYLKKKQKNWCFGPKCLLTKCYIHSLWGYLIKLEKLQFT